MKKRLSKDSFSGPVLILAVFGLLLILTYAVRTVAMPREHGLVQLSMPVVPAGLSEGLGQLRSAGQKVELGKATPMVVLTTDALFFGDLHSFTEDFADPRKKYKIAHSNGAPQLGVLTDQMQRWSAKRAKKVKSAAVSGSKKVVGNTSNKSPQKKQLIIFLPAPEVPMPIVIQIVAALEASSKVVLATSL